MEWEKSLVRFSLGIVATLVMFLALRETDYSLIRIECILAAVIVFCGRDWCELNGPKWVKPLFRFGCALASAGGTYLIIRFSGKYMEYSGICILAGLVIFCGRDWIGTKKRS